MKVYMLGLRESFFIVTAFLLLSAPASEGQTVISRRTVTTGNVQVNSAISHNVQIMAVFPPTIGSQDYTTFRSNVMNQSSVDGVTVNISWSQVETALPSSAPCSPLNSSTCQRDSVGQYHTYDWSAYESRTLSTGIFPWFDQFGGVYKKVNLILSGINAGGAGVNTATPWYVFSTNYISNFPSPYNRQDVMNTVKDCSGNPWSGQTVNGSTVTFTRSGMTVTVYSQNCCNVSTQPNSSLHTGDTVWTYGGTGTPGSQYNVPGGTTLTVVDGNDFSYTVSLSGGYSCTSGCAYIALSQSSPVPYEQPYMTAWEAFMAAANLRFSPNYQANGVTVGAAGTNQLGYVRSGTWSGGESFVYCITGGTSGGLSNLAAPYKYVFVNGGNTNTNNTWLADFNAKIKYIQSLSPTMYRYWPIDIISNDNTYPDTMAPDAVAAGNAQGYINGFGSQALSLLDYLNGCSAAVADWCNLFSTYHPYGSPLELQQISISDPQ